MLLNSEASPLDNDSVANNLKLSIAKHIDSGDTLTAIKHLNRLSLLFSNRVNFSAAYDGYWRALLLAEEVHAQALKGDSYNGLAILYSLFERKSEALAYYQNALILFKNEYRKTPSKEIMRKLASTYFLLATHYRFGEGLGMAREYLDSARQATKQINENSLLIEAEAGYQMAMAGNLHDAQKLLKELEAKLAEEHPTYMVIFNATMGDIAKTLGDFQTAGKYYESCISKAVQHLSHLNYIPDVYENLAEVSGEIGNCKQENDYLRISHSINEWLYSSRSTNNKELLEIKDQFRQEKLREERALKEQKLRALEHESSIWLLKTSLLGLVIAMILSTGFVLQRRTRKKHQYEKQMLTYEKEIKEQKNREIIAIKNSELTNSALKIIAKDELLSSIQSELSEIAKRNNLAEIQKIIKSIKLDKDLSWLEFETQFNSINNDFFNRLRQRYPSLKQYDLKICALIKLNFSGKDIARILGISVESANTSRYRLRKRLGLTHDENLFDFINNI